MTMKETIFTLAKGTEVPVKFDGATIPIMAAGSNEDMLKIAGDKAYVVFNRAHLLDVQKEVKAYIGKDDAENPPTIEGARKLAASAIDGEWYKDAGNRTRSVGGVPKGIRPQAVAAVLGDDFLAMLTPEQRALYDKKMAEQAARGKKPEAAAPAAAVEAASTPPAQAAAQTAPKGKAK